jgi:CheY-like chemotaxis protein
MILLVEDDPVTCHIMAAVLKRLRLPYGVSHDGAQALAHVSRHPVDLIVTDLVLPDANGLDLIEQILTRPHLQDIPVMFCTTRADPKTVERALALGAVDFVKKPINVDGFATRVTRALKRAPARWEPWRDVIRRLHVDSRTFEPLLTLARDALAELVQTLSGVVDGRTTIADVGADALAARVVRVRGAALNVGAIRTVQLIDYLWSGAVTEQDVAGLHAALVIELGVVEQAVQRRGNAVEAVA